MITIKYDDTNLQDAEVVTLAEAMKEIVIDATGIPEVFVYADSPRIKINVAPIEIFIEMSASKISDREILFQEIKNRTLEWKNKKDFSYPVSITLIPMDWKFETGI